MSNKRELFLNKFVPTKNFFITIFSLTLSYYLNFNRISYNKEYLLFIVIIISLTPLININSGYKNKDIVAEILYLRFLNSSTILIISLVIIAGLKLIEISRLFLIIFIVINFFLGVCSDLLLNKIIKNRAKNTKNILLYADINSIYFIRDLQKSVSQKYNIMYIIMKEGHSLEEKGISKETKIVNDNNFNLQKILRNQIVDDIFYIREHFNIKDIKIISKQALEVGVDFHLTSNFINHVKSKSQLSFIEEKTFFSMSTSPDDYVALKVKEIFDKVFSFFILLILSPLLIIIAIAIKLESKGPVFFIQKRQGLRNRDFMCYKFRTMVENAENLKKELMDKNEQKGPVFKIKNDPRITKLGKILRKTSLDELPQFFNVLKGEMSIVGPRPPVEEEVKKYKSWQLRRLSMKPGITCIWQVAGRNDISFERWMELDLEYIDNWSLKLDFELILKTIFVIIKANGQ